MRAQGASEMKNFAFSHSKKLTFFPARSFNEVGKTGKEERKSKNENTRLRRWGMENLTVLPYLRIYFRVLNAIEKSCFETLHTTSCVARTALDRLCPEVGRSSTLRRNLLLFMVTRLYCWRGCLSKKGPPHTTCNPTRMLCHKHVNGCIFLTFRKLFSENFKNIRCEIPGNLRRI